MRDILRQHLKRSREQAELDSETHQGALGELKEGLAVLFSRPDRDGLRSSLLPIIQNEVESYRPFMPVLQKLAEDSLLILQDKDFPVEQRASRLFVLENIIAHIRNIKNPSSRDILIVIRDAKVKIPKDVTNYRRLNTETGETASPSSIAKRILKSRAKEEKKRAKAEKKAKKAQNKPPPGKSKGTPPGAKKGE